MTFKFEGDYLYECYQMPNTSTTNYLLGTLVESGKMRLLEVAEIIPTFTPNTETPIYDSSNI